MANTNFIDENQYFVESKKAIQIVLEKEALLGKQLKTTERLELVKKYKELAKTDEEYDELEKQERSLGRKIKFNQLNEPAIPEEHKEKVKRNVAVEQLAFDEKLNELKLKLQDQVEHMEKEVLPLLTSIAKLESMKGIPDQIQIIADAEIGEEVPIKLDYRLKLLRTTPEGTRAGVAQKGLTKVLKVLEQIQMPMETLKEGGKK